MSVLVGGDDLPSEVGGQVRGPKGRGSRPERRKAGLKWQERPSWVLKCEKNPLTAGHPLLKNPTPAAQKTTHDVTFVNYWQKIFMPLQLAGC